MSVLSRLHRGQLVSIVAVGAVVGLAAAGVGGAFSSNSGHTITAEFADAQSLDKGNTVHVDGVTAGTVTSIHLKHNMAYVTLDLQSGFWPIHTDATADVRPVSLLGEDYVDLHMGSASAPPLPNGGTITVNHTTNSVNLQSVLDAINDPTATALALLITTFGQGMAGQGANSAYDLRALAPALNDTTAVTNLLDQQDQTLQSLLDQVTPVTNALAADKGRTLGSLVTDANTTLSATATQATALGQDLQELPGFFASTTTAFDQLATLSDQATPALQALDPLTDNLAAFSTDMQGFASAAEPAVTELKPVLDSTDHLLSETGPVVKSLQTSAPAQVADASSLIPIVERGLTGACTANDCPGLDDIFGFVRNWSLATQNYDGLSHYFRFFSYENNPAATLPVGSLPVPAAPATTAPVITVPTLPAVTVPAVGSGIAKALSPVLPPVTTPTVTTPPVTTNSPSATGLSPTQEHNLFSYLLGGS